MSDIENCVTVDEESSDRLNGYLFKVSVQDHNFLKSLEEAEKTVAALVDLGFTDVTIQLEPLYGEKADLFGVRF